MADTDYLKDLDAKDVAAFYRRLAAYIDKKIGGESLAAMLLLHWLDGKGADKFYPAKYVRNLAEVRSYLKDTARPIFLSNKLTPSHTRGGIVPRIKGTIKSKSDLPGGPYSMHLEGNVEISLTVQARAAMGLDVDSSELDALYGLHGFTLISDVVVSAAKTATSGFGSMMGYQDYQVNFKSWKCKASDEYHWNPDKYLAVPNPDYGSKAKGAVAPDKKTITVYHRNAARVEKAGLAAPYHDESEPWDENDATVIQPTTVRI